jgi:hypothetical protein
MFRAVIVACSVVLCPTAGINMIVFEGGPKGIRKITKLMLKR